MINDYNALISWINKTFATDEIANDFQDEFYKEYKVDTDDYLHNEKEFLRYLKENNTGLKLYKGNTSTFAGWNALDINGDIVITLNCN